MRGYGVNDFVRHRERQRWLPSKIVHVTMIRMGIALWGCPCRPLHANHTRGLVEPLLDHGCAVGDLTRSVLFAKCSRELHAAHESWRRQWHFAGLPWRKDVECVHSPLANPGAIARTTKPTNTCPRAGTTQADDGNLCVLHSTVVLT